MTRDEAIEILRYLPINIGRQNGKHLIQEAMNMAIEALERKRGEWVYLYEDNYKCSICASWWCCTDSQIDEMSYCPNCGADMRSK